MSWEYSENILVQNSAGNLLQDALEWDVHFAYNKKVLGENGTFGRKSYKDIVLTRYLRIALFDNNNWLTQEQCENAIKVLLSYSSTNTLMQINREKYSIRWRLKTMAVSYKRLFHLMIEKDITAPHLQKQAGFSGNVLTRLRRDSYVSLESIETICKVLR